MLVSTINCIFPQNNGQSRSSFCSALIFQGFMKFNQLKIAITFHHNLLGLTDVKILKHVIPYLVLRSLQNVSFHSYPASTDKMQLNFIFIKRCINHHLPLFLKRVRLASVNTLCSPSQQKFIINWNPIDHQAKLGNQQVMSTIVVKHLPSGMMNHHFNSQFSFFFNF